MTNKEELTLRFARAHKKREEEMKNRIDNPATANELAAINKDAYLYAISSNEIFCEFVNNESKYLKMLEKETPAA